MEKIVKTVAALSLLVVMAACNRGGDVEEYVAATPIPVTVEPVFTGKYN